MTPVEKEVDYLIAGQGVCGTFLARVLIERGCRVRVVDDAQRGSSSRVAAGLLNPITGMRLRLADDAPALLATSKKCFARLEREHGQTVFTPTPIRRLYASEKERSLKARRYGDDRYAALMSPDEAAMTPSGTGADSAAISLRDELGSFHINGGGWVDLPLLLDLEAAWLRTRGSLECGIVHVEDMRHDGADGVFWNSWHARRGVVFCNGWHAGRESCWTWLPWQPAKGEIIDCETRVLSAPWILNRGGWAIPLGGGRWRSGSTWDWKQLDDEPTPEAGKLLCERLQGFFKTPLDARLVRHRAGVRPCVLGNEPLCGTHPQAHWLHLFGGLGPKGTFWGPACAEHLADWLCAGKPLPPRFDLRRFWNRLTAQPRKPVSDSTGEVGKAPETADCSPPSPAS